MSCKAHSQRHEQWHPNYVIKNNIMSSVMTLYRSKKYQSVNKAYIINKPAQNHKSRRTNHPVKT